ncbi:Protein phosphatase 2C, putative [Hepatocystis sp. ex Piliocolobus tephrosceles]|nr:Protein phosphatase 2C, putative [Hepatocystis sp. ex Piliocolobus tephrosceles]
MIISIITVVIISIITVVIIYNINYNSSDNINYNSSDNININTKELTKTDDIKLTDNNNNEDNNNEYNSEHTKNNYNLQKNEENTEKNEQEFFNKKRKKSNTNNLSNNQTDTQSIKTSNCYLEDYKKIKTNDKRCVQSDSVHVMNNEYNNIVGRTYCENWVDNVSRISSHCDNTNESGSEKINENGSVSGSGHKNKHESGHESGSRNVNIIPDKQNKNNVTVTYHNKKIKLLNDLTDEEIINYIKLAFIKTDEQFLNVSKYPKHGCTVISLIFLKNKMFVVNLGDCRAIGIVNINNTMVNITIISTCIPLYMLSH